MDDEGEMGEHLTLYKDATAREERGRGVTNVNGDGYMALSPFWGEGE